MKKQLLKTIAKNILFYGIVCAGVILFMLVAGEENPDEPMTLAQFASIKFGSLAGLFLLVKVGKVLYNAGCFPEHVMKEIEEEEI